MRMMCVALCVTAAMGIAQLIQHGEAPTTAADMAPVLGTYWTIGAGVLALLAWAGSQWLKTNRAKFVDRDTGPNRESRGPAR